jgi:predicted secreted protein
MVQDPQQVIQVRFNKTYAKFFDEFFNCELSNRAADSGFIETDRPQL